MHRNRFFQLLLLTGMVCLLLFGMMHMAVAETEGDFEYSVSNGNATVTGYIGAGSDVVIPDTLGGYSVTSIGYTAFAGCRSLISVNIPDSVISIGNYAFSECSSLIGVNIPDGVTSIGDGAFLRCSSMTDIHIPATVESIGESAFEECSNLTNVIILNPSIEIGAFAFAQCGLRSISIPEEIDMIKRSVFFGCTQLRNLIIPSNIVTIDVSAFASCYALESVILSDRLTSIGTLAFYNCGFADIVIPASVTSIQDYAFDTHVTIHCYKDSIADTWAQTNGNPIWYICDHEAEVLPKVEPTCTEDGLTEGSKCDICGYENMQEVVPATGHEKSEEYIYNDDSHWKACSRCGERIEKGIHYSHCTNPDVCEVCGGISYTVFHGNTEKYQHDREKHWKMCPDCDEILNEMPHYVFCTNASSTTCSECEAEYEERLLFHRKDYFWEYNDTHHWTRCDVCKDYEQIDDLEEHVRNEKDPIHCSKCKIELPALPGDADGNGKLEMTDVMAVLEALSAGSAGENLSKAEVNNDGVVDVKDVLMMLRSLNGWDVKLQ